ncbi:MAG: DUF72 domain-containing protein [Sphaerochaeta sp.]|nr:DUF72 domain-containing protein [Sphaerochaeta sp.]
MKNIYVGSCSWKYPSWEGLVYSSRSPENYLAEYARKYNSVEIDQWFWSLGKKSYALPNRTLVAEYNDATPSDFRFTIKCPNTITSFFAYRGGTEPNRWFLHPDVFNQFFERIEPLQPKLGLLMFQFEYLNKDKMDSQKQFLDRLDTFFSALPKGLPYAVEIRNPRWIGSSWFSFLKGQQVAPVLLQGYWMDDVTSTLQRYGKSLGDVACIRLHGDDRQGIEKATGDEWNRIVTPRDEELTYIAPLIAKIAKEGSKLYININNHYEGSSPVTISKLEKLLEKEG